MLHGFKFAASTMLPLLTCQQLRNDKNQTTLLSSRREQPKTLFVGTSRARLRFHPILVRGAVRGDIQRRRLIFEFNFHEE